MAGDSFKMQPNGTKSSRLVVIVNRQNSTLRPLRFLQNTRVNRTWKFIQLWNLFTPDTWPKSWLLVPLLLHLVSNSLAIKWTKRIQWKKLPSSQILPVHIGGQEQVNPLSSSSQFPPLEHGPSLQSSIFSLQFLPVHPASHMHVIYPVNSCVHDLALPHVVLSQSIGIGAISVGRYKKLSQKTNQELLFKVVICKPISRIKKLVTWSILNRLNDKKCG